MRHASSSSSFLCSPKGGTENEHHLLQFHLAELILPQMLDRWIWSLDALVAYQLNLSLRGVEISSILCLICNASIESTSHLLFSCPVAHQMRSSATRWWELDEPDFRSYDEWLLWFKNIRIKAMLPVIERFDSVGAFSMLSDKIGSAMTFCSSLFNQLALISSSCNKDDRYAVSNGGGYAILISGDEYAELTENWIRRIRWKVVTP
ncbi:hypothetical protein Tco_1113565 [Tanacetum coccineum]|uniref:Reverse transcriptase zinc-binding domain-containing protein n=1 Tax=Tanacetum coccineum TaxID=301880 RepID=A0ABQ5IUV9_9ASTR